MAGPHGNTLCTMCDQHGKLMCSGCKSMHYCSKACQKADWPVHKLICRTFNSFMVTRPSLDHYSVIYFANDEALPRFKWMQWADGHNHPGHKELAPLGFDAERVQGHGSLERKINIVLDRHIEPQHITMSLPLVPKPFEDPTDYQKLPPNQSLLNIDQELSDWLRGPIVVWGSRCEGDVCKAASLNLGPMDFRHAIDELRAEYSAYTEPYDTLQSMICPDRQVTAVRMNCKGDKEVCGRHSYESVIERTQFLTDESEIPTPIADQIGIPLIVRKVVPGLLWRDRCLKDRMINYGVGTLNPPHQPYDTGSLIVARKDGKPLLPVHMHALAIYTGARLKDPALPKNACITPDILKLDRLRYVSKEDFENWYSTEWVKYPNSDKSAPSPFTISHDFEGPINDLNLY